MFQIGIENMVALLGYLGVFLLMIPNGFIGLPSSQILYIIAGYFLSTGSLLWIPTVLAGALGNTIGNIALYELVRRKGIGLIKKYKIFREDTIEKVNQAFQKKGACFLFVGKLTPALKVFAPIPPALGKMNRSLFIFVIFISSAIWAIPFLSIGYFFGESADVLGKYAVLLVIVALIIAYLFYRYIQSQPTTKEKSARENKGV